jgi:hypothetical protein
MMSKMSSFLCFAFTAAELAIAFQPKLRTFTRASALGLAAIIVVASQPGIFVVGKSATNNPAALMSTVSAGALGHTSSFDVREDELAT